MRQDRGEMVDRVLFLDAERRHGSMIPWGPDGEARVLAGEFAEGTADWVLQRVDADYESLPQF
jgi:hypothetical protein